MLSPLLSVRCESQCMSVCVASRWKSPGPEASHVPLPLAGQSVPCGHHQGFALQKAAYGYSRSLRVAGALYRASATSRSFGFCMSVVGASRRSAAPGSQSVESRRHRRRALSLRRVASGSISAGLHRASWILRTRARVMPNPSIERTRPGKPGRASHVKRWASAEAISLS
jgi:hypothetical protein